MARVTEAEVQAAFRWEALPSRHGAAVAYLLCVLVGSPCPAWSVASALAHQDTGRLLQALRVLQPSILSARRKHIIANVLLGRQLAPCTPEVEAQLGSPAYAAIVHLAFALCSTGTVALDTLDSSVGASPMHHRHPLPAPLRWCMEATPGHGPGSPFGYPASVGSPFSPTNVEDAPGSPPNVEEHSAPEPDADTTDAALDYFAEVAVACVGVVAGGGLPTPASHLQLPSLSVLEAARGAVEALPQYRFMELARALPVTDAAIAVSTAVCILLGLRPSWSDMQALLEDPSLSRRLVDLQPDQIQIGPAYLAGSVLQVDDLVTAVASTSLEALTVLFHWLVGMVDSVCEPYDL